MKSQEFEFFSIYSKTKKGGEINTERSKNVPRLQLTRREQSVT